MSKVACYLGSNILSRSRIIGEKQYYSFIIMAHNQINLNKINEYFTIFPLLSSKYLDYKAYVLQLQESNASRTTYNWDHLKNCYLTK